MGCGGLGCLVLQTLRTQGSCRRRGHFHSCGAVKDRWQMEYVMLHSIGEPPIEHEKLALLPCPSQPPPRSLARQEHPAPPGRTPRLGTQAPRLGPLKNPRFSSRNFAPRPRPPRPRPRRYRRVAPVASLKIFRGSNPQAETSAKCGAERIARRIVHEIHEGHERNGSLFVAFVYFVDTLLHIRAFSQRFQAIARSSAHASQRRVPSAFPCRLSGNADPAIAVSR